MILIGTLAQEAARVRLTESLKNAMYYPGKRDRASRVTYSVQKPAIQLLGVRIDRLTEPALLSTVLSRAKRRMRTTVLYVNAHCMNLQFTDPNYHILLDKADIVYCDGTGVRLAAWMTGQHIPSRMTGADWIAGLCAACKTQEVSLFLLGGQHGSAQDAARVLVKRTPGLKIVGTAPGFGMDSGLIDRINRLAPDIVLVGMGSPRQE